MNDRQLFYALAGIILFIFGMTVLIFSIIDIANNQEEVNLTTLKPSNVKTLQWIFLSVGILSILLSFMFLGLFLVSKYRVNQKIKSTLQSIPPAVEAKFNNMKAQTSKVNS